MKSCHIERARDSLVAILVFLMIALPVNLQEIKAAILLICIVLSIVYGIQNRVEVNRGALTTLLFWVIYVLITGIVGIINNNDGIVGFFRVNLLYYTAFFIVVTQMNRPDSFETTIKGIYWGTWFIAIYTLYLLLYGVGLFHALPMIQLDDTANIGMHSGYTHVTNTNLSMTIFVFPLLALSADEIIDRGIVKQKPLLACCVLCAAMMLLSGRRILWIVLAITTLILILHTKSDIVQIIRRLAIIIIIATALIGVATAVFGITFDGYVNRLVEVFNGINENGSENVRLEQSRILIGEFSKHPLFGSGAGGVIEYYHRSSTTPWSFEMSYHATLFHSGLIGFVCYAISILNVYKIVIKTVSKFRNAVLVAYTASIVATATNPYLGASFDFWVFLFIPIMYACCYSVNCDSKGVV